MAEYRQPTRYDCPMFLLIPTYTEKNAVRVPKYPESGVLFFGSMKTFGGTETEINGVYGVEDTATIETWYRPDIKADCRIKMDSGEVFEILGTPEDIKRRHQYLKFKVRRIGGGA